MNNNNTNISLELLLLNDLLRTKVIDSEIYEKAAEKIMSLKKTTSTASTTSVLATA